MDPVIFIPIVLYFSLITVIGFYFRKSSSSGIKEFFIGGRKMNRFVVTISSVVSGRSLWLLLIFTSQAYLFGLSSFWMIPGYLIIEFLMFWFYAPRLKKFAEKNDCITIPDFFSARFKDNSGYLRVIIAIVFVIFMITFIPYLLIYGGKFLYFNFGINNSTAIILVAVILLFYSIIGGFRAISVSDILLSIVLLLVFLILPVFTIIDFGGLHEFQTRLTNIDQKLYSPLALSTSAIIGFLGLCLASPGNPHIIVRYMSINDPSDFKWAAIVGTIWSTILASGAFVCGIMARVYFPNIESIPGNDSANVFLTLSNAVLPAILIGLVLVAFLGSLMSTASSYLLIVSSSVIKDLYENILKKKQKNSGDKLMFQSRIALIVIVYIAIILSLFLNKYISGFMLDIWVALAASLGPITILSIFWEKTTKIGVITGLFTGIVTVILWKIIPELNRFPFELIAGFFLSLITTILVSLIEIQTRKTPENIFLKKVKNFKPVFEEGN